MGRSSLETGETSERDSVRGRGETTDQKDQDPEQDGRTPEGTGELERVVVGEID